VIFVGRILPHKGLDILIRALPGDVSLKVFGQAAEDNYFALLKGLAAGRDVEFRIDATSDEVATGYRESIVAVLPSVVHDCFGNLNLAPELLGLVLLEAMASGTPVIGSDVGGIPEVVEHDATGLVVSAGSVDELREAILELCDDPQRAQRLGRTGARAVRDRYRWSDVADRCMAIYSALRTGFERTDDRSR
jgi:glycosyltransferase involved in cell wall biosynthesis